MNKKHPKVYEIRTVNSSFNQSFKILAQHHTAEYILSKIWLIADKKPKGIKTDRDWQYYFDNLMNFIEIGKRNKWLEIHVNGKGFSVYLTIPGVFEKETK